MHLFEVARVSVMVRWAVVRVREGWGSQSTPREGSVLVSHSSPSHCCNLKMRRNM